MFYLLYNKHDNNIKIIENHFRKFNIIIKYVYIRLKT